MGYQDDPRMLDLRRRQSREIAELYDQFVNLHPELNGHTDHAGWPPAVSAAYRDLAAKLLKKHQKQMRTLVVELGRKLSPLSELELAESRC